MENIKEDLIWVAEIKCPQFEWMSTVVCATVEEIREIIDQLIPEDMDFSEMKGVDINITWAQIPVEEFDALEDFEAN